MNLTTHVYYVPPVNLMSRGCLNEAGPHIRQLGGRNALVVTDAFLLAMKDACAPGNPFQPTKEEVVKMFEHIL